MHLNGDLNVNKRCAEADANDNNMNEIWLPV